MLVTCSQKPPFWQEEVTCTLGQTPVTLVATAALTKKKLNQEKQTLICFLRV